MITLLYFASLRERLDCCEEKIELPVDIRKIAELQELLSQRGESWHDVFGGSGRVLCAINQQMAKPGNVIDDNDEVAFFPPVTGG